MSEKSIAVLPFKNLSTDPENAFLADGVQDEVLTNLAKLADLDVISRTSAAHYKTGIDRNMRDIARELGVAYVVEGSAQRVGDRIRVSAQLINARTDSHLWAEHYDRQVADVFAIQSEIAQGTLLDQLHARLSPEEKTAIGEQPTDRLERLRRFTPSDGNWLVGTISAGSRKKAWRKAIELLEEATQRDPTVCRRLVRPRESARRLLRRHWRSHARSSRRRKRSDAALRLRPDLGEAHRELARYSLLRLSITIDAYDELTIARRTLPNDSEAFFESPAGSIADKNRWDASLAQFAEGERARPAQ